MSRRTGERPRVVEMNPRVIASPPTTPIRHDSVAPRESSTSMPMPEMSSIDQFEGIKDIHDDLSWMLGPTPDTDMPVDSYFDVNSHILGPDADCNTAPSIRHDPTEFLNTPSIQGFDLSFDFSLPRTDRKEAVVLQPKRSESTASNNTSSAISPRQRNSDLRQRKAHDCASEALALVANFHVAARGCLTAAKDGVGRLDLEDGTLDTHEIETVLSRNREAMKKLNGILDCQCSLSQEVLVMVYLAVGKVISWYAAILGDDANSPSDQSHSALMGRIAAKPVFKGSYCLDTQAQRVFSAHAILAQLKEHVAPLVKRSGCRHSSPSNGTSMSSRASSSHPSPTSLGSGGGLIECHHQRLQEQLNRLILRANSIKQS
ncbi:hypothetical protein AC579_8466 [Pseudocercospora musae]|uniref:Aflatoxin regulatory protein domain-containing protein n=1 Tax=Pseudocercospora musae TaxID=113226 RepID=A0A139I2G4_9PEZI|nr:hypothetical protein AC579_8466 [Pseudocercospora musae]